MFKKRYYKDDDILERIIRNVKNGTNITLQSDNGGYYDKFTYYLFEMKIQIWWYMNAHISVDDIELEVDEKKCKPLFLIIKEKFVTRQKEEDITKMENIRKLLDL